MIRFLGLVLLLWHEPAFPCWSTDDPRRYWLSRLGLWQIAEKLREPLPDGGGWASLSSPLEVRAFLRVDEPFQTGAFPALVHFDPKHLVAADPA